MSNQQKTVTVIGAGPIGLEAALYAQAAGYNVSILEKGEVASHVRQWGHVTLFSPFSMNYSPLGKRTLSDSGHTLPADDAYLSGEEYFQRYLQPLASSESLQNAIIENVTVLAISRQQILKNEHIGNGQRQNFPFRILARHSNGREQFYYTDIVIDASGSFSQPNWLGEGGIPALGEQGYRNHIEYGLPDISGTNADRYRGKTTLVVGAGHSAGTTIANFQKLLSEDEETQVIWLTRNSKEQPLQAMQDDPLPGREKVVTIANELCGHSAVRRIGGASVHALDYRSDSDQFVVEISNGGRNEVLTVDRIIANVGYSPDNSIYRELQVHECYASRGPMKLAAALLGESSADCLTQSSKGPDVLKNPEPNFFIIGMKSYGKNSNFLLRVGFEQIRDVFQLISGDEALDLYAAPASLAIS